MQRVFLITALRTPIALRRGGLSHIRPEVFAASVVRELLHRTNIPAASLDGVFAGNAVGTGGNIARLMSLLSGIPSFVPAVTIDMQCASAAASISLAFAKIAAGQGDCYLAGGMESVSLQPARTYAEGDPRRAQLAVTGGTYYTAELAPGDLRQDAMLWGAERVMEQEHVTRAELDRWVLESHHRAAAAAKAGVFREWMLPIEGCTRDEGIKPRMDQRLLDRLPPVLGAGTLLTAANACRTNDGAAFVLLASERFVREYHLAPALEILATAAAGVNPEESPRGAMATAEKLLTQQHVAWTDLAAIEFNEAFAVIDASWSARILKSWLVTTSTAALSPTATLTAPRAPSSPSSSSRHSENIPASACCRLPEPEDWGKPCWCVLALMAPSQRELSPEWVTEGVSQACNMKCTIVIYAGNERSDCVSRVNNNPESNMPIL